MGNRYARMRVAIPKVSLWVPLDWQFRRTWPDDVSNWRWKRVTMLGWRSVRESDPERISDWLLGLGITRLSLGERAVIYASSEYVRDVIGTLGYTVWLGHFDSTVLRSKGFSAHHTARCRLEIRRQINQNKLNSDLCFTCWLWYWLYFLQPVVLSQLALDTSCMLYFHHFMLFQLSCFWCVFRMYVGKF